MSTPTGPGWFENPDNPDELRYFDGIIWTANTTPLRTRRPEPPVQAPPPGPPGAPAPRPEGWGPQPHQQHAPVGAPSSGRTLDVPGQPQLAGYGLRVLAYVLDLIILVLPTLIAGGWFLWKAIDPIRERLDTALVSGNVTELSAVLSDARAGYLGAFLMVQVAVFLAYHTLCLVRWGATPGKLMVGISVRRLDRPGPPDLDTALRRSGFQALAQALSNLPFVSVLGTMLMITDLVWPVADAKNQALHDKVAGTIVVKGRAQR